MIFFENQAAVRAMEKVLSTFVLLDKCHVLRYSNLPYYEFRSTGTSFGISNELARARTELTMADI